MTENNLGLALARHGDWIGAADAYEHEQTLPTVLLRVVLFRSTGIIEGVIQCKGSWS